MKIKIKVTINEEVNIYNALKIDNKIIYTVQDFKVIIDLKNKSLEKETLEYKIKLLFSKNEKTEGFLNINNNILSLEIFTNDIIISENLIMIDYNIVTTLESVIYKVEVIYE